MPSPISEFNFATFNVRGLTTKIKKEALERDLAKFKIDLCALQETKSTKELDEQIGGYRLITYLS